MSRICEISGKRALSGNNRSHSLRATRRKWNVNLQTVTINGQKVKVAARTLRTLKKQNIV